MTRVTLHLAPAAYYHACDRDAPYVPQAFAQDGFIHCTDGAADLAAVGNRYYRDEPGDFVVLVIDVSKVRPRVVYEDAARIYPHIYGPLNRDAILAVLPAARTTVGTFLTPDVAA